MTIKDRFLKKEETERNEREKSRLKFVEDLGRELNAALLDPKFIQKATPLLEEHGCVRFTDVGCLCQSGLCEKQRGFKEYCQEAIEYWKTEGVDVRFDITSGLEVQGSGKYVSRDSYPSTTLLSNN